MNQIRNHAYFCKGRFADVAQLDAVIVPSRLDRTFDTEIVHQLGALRVPIHLIPPCETPAVSDLPHGWQLLRVPRAYMKRYNSLSHVRMLAPGKRASNWQLPAKRTYALHWARRQGFHAVFLVDDDILIDANILLRATALLETAHCVSFPSEQFADKSTIGHIAKSIGLDGQVFLSGASLLVNPSKFSALFPQIYNEDWFVFLLLGLDKVASGGVFKQRPYHPYIAARARGQELGDLLAESLLERVAERDLWTSKKFWTEAISQRARLLDRLQRELSQLPQCTEQLACIQAAKDVLFKVKPAWCATFVGKILQDFSDWSSIHTL